MVMHRNLSYRLRRPAFTLVELLVVMGVMLLAITLSIPVIRILTGSRSQEAAQNDISSYLAYARTKAMGLQQTEGVLFYLDTTTDRVNCAAVIQSSQVGDPTGVTFLDLDTSVNPMPLPAGVRLWTTKDQPPLQPVTYADPFGNPPPRYLGFNELEGGASPNQPSILSSMLAIPGGVILFDGYGRVTFARYGFRYVNAGTNKLTAFGQLVFGVASTQTPPPIWPSVSDVNSNANYLCSQTGLVLFDRETFQNQMQQANVTPPLLDSNQTGTTETTIEQWLDVNTTPLFVNRYDGNLMRGQ